jgi:Na+-driven multidrug efflux pump
LALTFTIGILAALFPAAWISLFSADPAVLETGSMYLRVVAPFYALFGAGMALYFASQGAGRMLLPMLAGTGRLALVALGGALVVKLAGSLTALFVVVACGLIVFGGLTAIAVYHGTWGARPAREAAVTRFARGDPSKQEVS